MAPDSCHGAALLDENQQFRAKPLHVAQTPGLQRHTLPQAPAVGQLKLGVTAGSLVSSGLSIQSALVCFSFLPFNSLRGAIGIKEAFTFSIAPPDTHSPR